MAIDGASPNKDNFGLYLMNDLPAGVENLILAVPSELSEEIAEQAAGSGIKRIWMVNGMGKGAYSEKAHVTCTENQISPN